MPLGGKGNSSRWFSKIWEKKGNCELLGADMLAREYMPNWKAVYKSRFFNMKERGDWRNVAHMALAIMAI
jgi:hypothetical protein